MPWTGGILYHHAINLPPDSVFIAAAQAAERTGQPQPVQVPCRWEEMAGLTERVYAVIRRVGGRVSVQMEGQDRAVVTISPARR